MKTEIPIINYTQRSSCLYTGGKIDTTEKYQWIKEHHNCIVSLEDIPDCFEKIIRESYGPRYASFDRYSVEEKPLARKSVCEYIAEGQAKDRSIFMHCSAGSRLSPQLAAEYLREEDLHLNRYYNEMANQLNVPHQFLDYSANFVEAALAFYNPERTSDVIDKLSQYIESQDSAVKRLAQDTVFALTVYQIKTDNFRLTNHNKLAELAPKVSEALKLLHPEKKKWYDQTIGQIRPQT